jgi:glycosyltransferase involved in cell wall biosynthesis
VVVCAENRQLRTSKVNVQSIFYSNPDFYPPIINSARLLSESGINHHHLCREYLERMDINYPPDMSITRAASKTKNSLLEYLNFIRKALTWGRSDTDVFIGHDMHGFLVARLLGWRYRRPVIYHCHDFVENPKTLGATFVKQFERRFARTADLVIVPDRERAEVIADQLRLRKFPCVVANAPLHTPQKSEGLLRNALEDMGCSFDKVVLRQGRIGRGHCIDVTIRSIPFWQNPNWGFVIMGKGDEDYKQSLLQLAQELNVQDRFVVLPEVRYTDIMKYTVDADLGHALYQPVHVNNQFITTASNKIMEYMAAGVPVLLSETESSHRFLEQYEVGIAADIHSPESIAAAVNQILGGPDYAKRLGKNGRRAFEGNFRYDKQYASVLEYLQILATR